MLYRNYIQVGLACCVLYTQVIANLMKGYKCMLVCMQFECWKTGLAWEMMVYPIPLLCPGPVVRPLPTMIRSTEELLQELPDFIPPMKFCVCLGIPRCQWMVKDDRDVVLFNLAATWYQTHPYYPAWSNIVEALMCCGFCQEGRKLAERRRLDFERILHDSKYCTP